MNKIINELFIKSGQYKYKYYFDSDHYYRSWSDGADEGESSYPLHKLSSKYSRTKGRSDGVTEKIKISTIIMLASIVIYFSDYNEKIPLLAPVLLLLGIIRIYSIRNDILPSTWTIIRYENGEEATYIVHGNEDNEERISFEKSLADAIVKANKNET